MPSSLRILVDLISAAVTKIDEEYAAANLEFPSLNDVFKPEDPANALLGKQNIDKNASIIAAAAEQLAAVVRAPVATLWDMSLMYVRPACLQTVLLGGIPEILREAGPKGLHVQQIAKQNGLEPGRLSQVLRLLSVSHVFREVQINVFANNRISSALDTKKPSSEVLKRSPPNVNKFADTDGVAAYIEHITDAGMKAGVHLADNLFNPQIGHSSEPTESTFCQFFKTSNTFFGWLNESDNEYRRNRFHVGMRALQKSEPDGVIFKGFPWDSLPNASKIVDVGGGTGSVCLPVAIKFPHLKFVIQDTATDRTEQYWKDNIPGSVDSGRVLVQNHSFFEAQPIRDADVFLLRAVIHDWPTSYATRILRNLREAAVPGKTKLLMIDQIVQYACANPEIPDIPGAELIINQAPEPLLPNFGIRSAYSLDILMLIQFHAQERTLGDQIDLTSQTGWKITRIYSPVGSTFKQILAEAV